MPSYRENHVVSSANTAKKIPHVEAQKITDKMTNAQKEGIRVWNEMRDALLQANLMEKK